MPGRPGKATRVLLFLPAVLFLSAAAAAGGSRLLHSWTSSHDGRPHPHQSAHDGLVQAVGDHHVEVLLETGGTLRLFVLGEDETELAPLPLRELTVHLQPEAGVEAVPVTLRGEPTPGVAGGLTAIFVGTVPPALRGQPLALTATLPLGTAVRRVRIDLASRHAEKETDPAMPLAAGLEAQRRLYRTPGGLYTAADLRTNGTAPAAEKLRGVPVRHDTRPGVGDRLCPITRTKANPGFRWTVGGKQYLFCCPPCIDEFVTRAKTSPEEVEAPERYVQR